jgi:hypothetical protein
VLHSRLRWRWEGHNQSPQHQARATAAQARPANEALLAEAPDFDRAPGLRAAWLKGQESASPTALEGLAKCPFRSLAERVWGLQTFDARTRMSMAVGILVHHIMEEALVPFVGMEDWPTAFQTALGLGPEAVAEDLIPHLHTLWLDHQDQWLKELDRHIPQEQWPQAVLRLESLLPNLAAGLLRDVHSESPEKGELALLDPTRLSAPKAKKAAAPPSETWHRTLLALEGSLGPVTLDLGDDHSLAVSGKVDRIERWTSDSLSFLRVVDYKTSKETYLKAYAEYDAPFGSHLQTPLYMLLAEQVYPGERATAVLFPLKEEEPKPFTKHLATLAEAGPDGAWRQRLLTNLARFDARLELGDFPPTPGEHCGQCQLAALCGRPVDVTVESDGEGD